ncbi:interleukin-15 receptor subunit alpha isoform X2 [Vicugna pacos]|uniref:Interleukin-15 receptor subunit alpha isoform X2 n=1 Tax=Vicugna pacos TaxID=30538 RepID=A0ABM5CRV2_VICPA
MGRSLRLDSFAHSLSAGTRGGRGCWGHQEREGKGGGGPRASAGHSPGPRPARPVELRGPGGGAGVTAPPGLFPGEGVGMLSHGSVTASHLFPALGGQSKSESECGSRDGRSRSCGRRLLPGGGHLRAPAAGRPDPGEPARRRAGRGRGRAMAGPPRGCGAGALPALLLLLLLLLLLGPPATPGITCPTPTSVEHANIQVKSYNLNSRERYVCNSGFKRKAGTSSLTECVFNKTMNITHWTTPNLKCIRDPSLTHQRPPPTTTLAGVTPGPESLIPSGKGAGRYRARAVTAAVSVLVAVLGAVCVGLLLVCYRRSRQINQIPGVEMESTEVVPMAGGTDTRGEGTEH